MNDLPVVVIGAGPQGLAAAAHLLERGLEPLVLESGATAAPAVAEWGHVRLFSAWPELVDAASVRLLEPTGWAPPTQGYPTGAEWVEGYLAPLAAALGERVRYDARVIGVSRKGRDRLVDADRADQPFTIHLVDGTGTESRLEARAVIDASGTWRRPSPAGADGLPAIGERAAADLISYQVPDRARPAAYAGKHTVVVGSGDSAFNAVHELVQIAADHPGTRITWAIRRVVSDNTFGGGAADELPERGALGQRARAAVDSGTVQLVTGFRTAEVRREDDRAVLVSETGQELPGADTLVVLTGFRPDLSFLSEMRLDLDPTLEAPRRIATEIDPNLHSCGSARDRRCRPGAARAGPVPRGDEVLRPCADVPGPDRLRAGPQCRRRARRRPRGGGPGRAGPARHRRVWWRRCLRRAGHGRGWLLRAHAADAGHRTGSCQPLSPGSRGAGRSPPAPRTRTASGGSCWRCA